MRATLAAAIVSMTLISVAEAQSVADFKLPCLTAPLCADPPGFLPCSWVVRTERVGIPPHYEIRSVGEPICIIDLESPSPSSPSLEEFAVCMRAILWEDTLGIPNSFTVPEECQTNNDLFGIVNRLFHD